MPKPFSLHSLAMEIATGSTPEQLYADAEKGASAVPYDPARPDRAVHGLAAERMAQRFGPDIASLAGLGKEVVQGAGSLATGGKFYDVHGMDQEDLVANETGIQRAIDTAAQQKAAEKAVRPGFGLQSAEIKPGNGGGASGAAQALLAVLGLK